MLYNIPGRGDVTTASSKQLTPRQQATLEAQDARTPAEKRTNKKAGKKKSNQTSQHVFCFVGSWNSLASVPPPVSYKSLDLPTRTTPRSPFSGFTFRSRAQVDRSPPPRKFFERTLTPGEEATRTPSRSSHARCWTSKTGRNDETAVQFAYQQL